MKNNKGFTVIELMAVVSILSILAVIALAVYGDYVVRTKVAEGMGFAGEARTSVTEYYYNTRKMPRSNAQAGLAEPQEYNKYDYLRKLEIATQEPYGTITVTFKIPGTKADYKLLQLIPSTKDGIIHWQCIPPEENGIDVNQVPPNCRG